MSSADHLSVLPAHLYAAFAVSHTQGCSSPARGAVRHLVLHLVYAKQVFFFISCQLNYPKASLLRAQLKGFVSRAVRWREGT